MKNKNGFTLIELLAVVAVLGLVIIISVPSIMGINNMINANMKAEKGEIIEQAAILYGEDIKGSIISDSNSKRYNSYPCTSIIVGDLIPAYLDSDTDTLVNCITSTNKDGAGCIVDPSSEGSYMDEYEVIIYLKNRRIKAIIDMDGDIVCE